MESGDVTRDSKFDWMYCVHGNQLLPDSRAALEFQANGPGIWTERNNAVLRHVSTAPQGRLRPPW